MFEPKVEKLMFGNSGEAPVDIAVVTSSVGSKETEAFVLEPHLSMSDQVALIPSTPKTVRQGGVQRNKGTYTDTYNFTL